MQPKSVAERARFERYQAASAARSSAVGESVCTSILSPVCSGPRRFGERIAALASCGAPAADCYDETTLRPGQVALPGLIHLEYAGRWRRRPRPKRHSRRGGNSAPGAAQLGFSSGHPTSRRAGSPVIRRVAGARFRGKFDMTPRRTRRNYHSRRSAGKSLPACVGGGVYAAKPNGQQLDVGVRHRPRRHHERPRRSPEPKCRLAHRP